MSFLDRLNDQLSGSRMSKKPGVLHHGELILGRGGLGYFPLSYLPFRIVIIGQLKCLSNAKQDLEQLRVQAASRKGNERAILTSWKGCRRAVHETITRCYPPKEKRSVNKKPERQTGVLRRENPLNDLSIRMVSSLDAKMMMQCTPPSVLPKICEMGPAYCRRREFHTEHGHFLQVPI